jgi:hypothetical protein
MPLKGTTSIESKSSEEGGSGAEPVKKFGFDPPKSKSPDIDFSSKVEIMEQLFNNSSSDLVTAEMTSESEVERSNENDSRKFYDSSSSRVKKEIGTGLPFEPKAFSPPKTRPEPQDPNIIDVAFESSTVEVPSENVSARAPRPRTTSQPGPINLWGGESFKGTVTSRSYGVGFNRPVSGLDLKAAADASVSLKKQDVITDGTRPGSLGTMDDSKKLDDTRLSGGDAATESQGREKKDLESLEMELKLRLMEEKNRMLEEKLNTSRIVEETKQAKEQSYSNQIAELVEHIQRLEKEVGDSAAKAERALRSSEDEIKRMAEVIEVKTKSQSLLEAEREKLLTESNEIRLSAERQSKKDMEALKERLVDSAKSELQQLKSIYDKQMDSITEQLKTKLEQEKSLMKITQSQSKELEGLKEEIDRLQNERNPDSSVTISGNREDPQIDVEEMMETIQNIEPLHNVVLASDASSKEEAPSVGKESPMKNLPTYETFSKGKQKAANLYDTP